MSNENCAHAQRNYGCQKPTRKGVKCGVRTFVQAFTQTLLQAPRPGMPVWRAGPAGGAGRVVAGRPGPPQPVGSVRGAKNPKPRAPGRITAAACGPRAQGTHGPATRKLPSRRVRVQAPKVKRARVIAIFGRRPRSLPRIRDPSPAGPGGRPPCTHPKSGPSSGPRCEVADQVHQSPIPGPRRDVSTPLALESE
jgi:hypothetical protein